MLAPRYDPHRTALPELAPAAEAELRARYGDRADEQIRMQREHLAERAEAVERGEIPADPTGPQEEDATFVDV